MGFLLLFSCLILYADRGGAAALSSMIYAGGGTGDRQI
jgi:hypothetical protein